MGDSTRRSKEGSGFRVPGSELKVLVTALWVIALNPDSQPQTGNPERWTRNPLCNSPIHDVDYPVR